jgi:hypothetical protein
MIELMYYGTVVSWNELVKEQKISTFKVIVNEMNGTWVCLMNV